nr:MAG TPA: hypothetical protein [Caudoviricetes sp.]
MGSFKSLFLKLLNLDLAAFWLAVLVLADR